MKGDFQTFVLSRAASLLTLSFERFHRPGEIVGVRGGPRADETIRRFFDAVGRSGRSLDSRSALENDQRGLVQGSVLGSAHPATHRISISSRTQVAQRELVA